MESEAWVFMGLVVTNLAALAGIALQSRRGTQSLHDRVAPVSNGFASQVQASLARIERRLDDHMRGHK